MGSKRKRSSKDPLPADAGSQKRAKSTTAAAVSTSSTKSKEAAFAPITFTDAPTGDDRRREAALYDLLGSEDGSDRIKAAGTIISGLLGDESVPVSVVERHLERRLFRGLASGRNASRLGFSLVITEILDQLFGDRALAAQRFPSLTFDAILAMLVDKTQPVGNIPGQEERDHYFGQLFGLECFVKAKVLFRADWALRWAAVLELVLRLAAKKVWIRPQCGWLVVQAVQQMSEKQAQQTLSKLADTDLGKSPEGVAIWITVNARFPGVSVQPWKTALAPKNFGLVGTVLKEQVQEDSKDKNTAAAAGGNKQPNWTGQLHFVWDIILAHYVALGAEGLKEFETFWNAVVDDSLFSQTATEGQKFRGFLVFQKTLEAYSSTGLVPTCIFSKKLLASLMNQAAKKDRLLHRAATKALKTVEQLVAAQPACLPAVIKCLLSESGDYSFDQRTSTKTVDKILSFATPETEKAVVKELKKRVISMAKKDTDKAKTRLRTFTDYLVRLINRPANTETTTGAPGLAALEELANLAFSGQTDIPESLITEQIRSLCKTRLESVFSKMVRQADGCQALCKAVSAIDSSQANMDEAIQTELAGALKRMRSLMKVDAASPNGNVSQALAILHAVSILQLYNGEADALDVVEDLKEYTVRLKKGKQDAAGASEFLVEILLSLVVRPSSLMRQVSQQVFELSTRSITADGLRLLTEPLAQEENAKGQKELFNTEDDDEEMGDGDSDDEDEGDDDEDDIDSDVEFTDLKIVESGDGDDDDDDGNDDDDDDDDEEEDDDEEDKDAATGGNPDLESALDSALEIILKSHRLDKDDAAGASDSDASMSDSEMLQLDDKLAQVFRETAAKQSAQTKKRDQRDAKASVANFKNRILDLLDIYVRREPASPLALALLLPLLRLVRSTATRQLAAKAADIVHSYLKHLRKARQQSGADANATAAAPAQDTPAQLALLRAIHAEAALEPSHAFARAASSASLVVVATLHAADRAAVGRVAGVYAESQAAWVAGQVRLHAGLFTDWVNWCQSQAALAKAGGGGGA